MSMIDETAMENRHVQESHLVEIETAPPAAGQSWLTGHLIASGTVLVVLVAVGSAIAGLRAGQSEVPVATSDDAPAATSLVVARATVAEAPSAAPAPLGSPAPEQKAPAPLPEAPPVPTATPGGFGEIVVKATAAEEQEEQGRSKAGIETASWPAEKAAEPPQATPAGEPVASPSVDLKAEPDGGDGAPAAAKTPPVEAVAAPKVAPGETAPGPIETGSIDKDRAATGMVRMLSDANMRSGPGTSHPVLVAVPKGTAVELIGCRHWCEVVVAGQRGWIYKDFVGAPQTAHAR